MRRTICVLAIASILVAACGSSTPDPTVAPPPTPSDPAVGPSSGEPGAGPSSVPTASAPASQPAGPDDNVWLCKPGLAANPCTGNLDATVIDAGGARTIESNKPAADPPIDCFYVYPTVSRQETTNANLAIDPEERAVATAQAALFSKVCNVYAPMYPQLTLAAIATPGKLDLSSALVAYNGVNAAWNSYMSHYNRGRHFVLIGHSQGAFMLTALMKYQIDPSPQMRGMLVSALLMGGNVTVPVGKSVGGAFANIPACTSATQSGCVVAYSSFDATPPADALFGRTGSALDVFGGGARASLQILCVNPASPGGGTGSLDTYYPTTGLSSLVSGAAGRPVASTPLVSYPGEFSAHCQSANGATWLQIDRPGGANDSRPAAPRSESPGWGLHVVDVNLALGNLVELVASESANLH
jgi:hypothetical protein